VGRGESKAVKMAVGLRKWRKFREIIRD